MLLAIGSIFPSLNSLFRHTFLFIDSINLLACVPIATFSIPPKFSVVVRIGLRVLLTRPFPSRS